MSDGDRTGKIQTVLGLIEPDQLGTTLSHEHLLIDLSGFLPEEETASARELLDAPFSVDILGLIKHHAGSNIDDLQVRDVAAVIDEVMLFKQYGGNAIVEMTNLDLSRDPVGLARISRATDVHVIMGTSHYMHQAHPPDMDSRSEDGITEQMVTEVNHGVGDTRIRCGIIGEVGCTYPLTANELKVLKASVRAHRLTGAPLTIHPGRDEKSPAEIVDVLREMGADMEHTIIEHIERTLFDPDDFLWLAETGCYVEWDLIGEERSYYGGANTAPEFDVEIDMPNDAVRIKQMAWLKSQGYGNRILVGHDIGFKQRLAQNGGHGYHYILAHIMPRMRQRGFTEEDIQRIMVDNPREALTFVSPAGS